MKTTPKPRATKNSNGELVDEPPLLPPPPLLLVVELAAAAEVDVPISELVAVPDMVDGSKADEIGPIIQ